MNNIQKYLKQLGFSDFTGLENCNFGKEYIYKVNLSELIIKKIPFFFFNDKDLLYQFHLQEWNRNELDYFIAVNDNETYIYNAKEKPIKSEGLFNENNAIDSFNYGTTTLSYEDILSLPIHKENIDNSIFFNFVIEKQKDIKNEIDEYLLNNLLALRKKLLEFDNNKTNVNNIILKSLFVKYLEDRNILNNISIVEAFKKDINSVLEIFDSIKVINGDILKKDLDLRQEHINELSIFFTHDYTSKLQYLLYPFQFDKIPIELISNVYESFLGQTDTEIKHQNGVFYTRTFVVDFMLSQSIYKRIEKQPNATILDPACGSGIFLVQGLRKILNENKNKTIEEKADILKNQIFGIDIDMNALQITAFSLYLTLLDSCSINEIKNQIAIKSPILPPLIGKNLINQNTITDKIEFDLNGKILKTFDCIVSNPPWSQLKKNDSNPEIVKTKKEIKSSIIYKSIGRLPQISQAFILKINFFCNENSDISIVVNNSNFLAEESLDFRKELLQKFRIVKFFELSNIADILFKNTKHPCAVLILDKKNIVDNVVKYITPKLSDFSKKLRIITYTSKEEKSINQIDLYQDDIVWRIFVNGNWKDYQLIKKLTLNNNKDIQLKCAQGIQGQVLPSLFISLNVIEHLKNNNVDKEIIKYVETFQNIGFKNKTKLKNELFKKIAKDKNSSLLVDLITSNLEERVVESTEKQMVKYFDKTDFTRYSFGLNKDFLAKIKNEINWNNNIKRKREDFLFDGKRILLARQPNVSDDLKLKALYTNQPFVFPDKIIGVKIVQEDLTSLIFAIFNSKLSGYVISNYSSQWNKGRMNTILNDDIKNFPMPYIEGKENILNSIENKLRILEKNKSSDFSIIEDELDDLIFDLYDLLEFEKEIIREFYQINVERKNDIVNYSDLDSYIGFFRNSYQLFIKDNLRLNAEAIISNNIGTIVKFQFVDIANYNEELTKSNDISEILKLVKEKQIESVLLKGSLYEEKVKLYNEDSFYIIKSNYFKDWTTRQAMEDAKEEFNEMIKKLN